MNLKSTCKILLSLLLLTLVLSQVDLVQLKTTLSGIPPLLALAMVVGYMLGQCLSAFKWYLITDYAGIHSSYIRNLKSYFIGMFANSFAIGLVGGDVLRALLISDGKSNKAAALATVIADRAHGLAVLAFLGTVAAVCFGHPELNAFWIYGLIVLGGGIVLAWIAGPSLLLKFLPAGWSIKAKLERMASAFPRSPGKILAISLISGTFHLFQIWLHWLMAYGMGTPVPWEVLLVAVPFVNILTSLPLSWQGLGVREAAYIFFLTPAVLTSEQAIAFGAIWLLAVTATSCLGGILAFVTKDFSAYSKFPGSTRLRQA